MTSLGGRRRLALAVALTIAAGPLAASTARATTPTTCTESRPGGEWATYGQDLMGQNRQDAEDTIGTGNVAQLERVWELPETLYQSAPPIVSGGCVIINNKTVGRIQAYDIDDFGEPVWQSPSELDTTASFAVTVVDGRVHGAVKNDGSPKAFALDVTNGKLLWESDPVDFTQTGNQMSSGIVHEGIQVFFTTGPDFDPNAREGYALVDADGVDDPSTPDDDDGRILHQQLTSGEEANAASGGVWGTPTVDPVNDYLYVGTSNPEQKRSETDYDNSVIKLDLRRDRVDENGDPTNTFGKIVDIYKGTRDSYTGYDNPVCENLGENHVNAGVYGSSPICGQLDVDFGKGPTLFRVDGVLYGAIAQKSGYFHLFNAETMEAAWEPHLLWPTMSFLGGNLAKIAVDEATDTLYLVGNPGILYSLDGSADEWTVNWQVPLTGLPQKGGNVALANGVVYYVDEPGLKAFDAQTGELLWRSELQEGATIGSGVSVAEHTVVASHYGTMAAYRLPD